MKSEKSRKKDNTPGYCDPRVRLEMMIKNLKEHEFRLTPQRLAVLKILAKSEGHPTVEDIFKKLKPDFPTTSIATIYKTVNLLKEIGEVVELDFSEISNRYDGIRPYPHPHLICTQCKRIVDLDMATIKDLPKELAKKTGYEIVNYRLDFFAVCPRCQSDN